MRKIVAVVILVFSIFSASAKGFEFKNGELMSVEEYGVGATTAVVYDTLTRSNLVVVLLSQVDAYRERKVQSGYRAVDYNTVSPDDVVDFIDNKRDYKAFKKLDKNRSNCVNFINHKKSVVVITLDNTTSHVITWIYE